MRSLFVLLVFCISIGSYSQGLSLSNYSIAEKDTKEVKCDTIEWNHYFVRYFKVNSDGTYSNTERTWYYLAPLTNIKPAPGYITITGLKPRQRFGISDKLYKDIYYCMDKKDMEEKVKDSINRVSYSNNDNGEPFKGNGVKTDNLGNTKPEYDPNSEHRTVTVKMPSGKIFRYKKWGSINKFKRARYWSNAFSLVTVPVKARRGSGVVPRRTIGGLNNVVLNLDLGWQEWHRYYSSGKDISFRLAGGIFFGPSIHDVKINELTTPVTDRDTKQLFFSWGISFSFAVNDVNFLFVPFGMDHSTGAVGNAWAFNERRWWGFGIGVKTQSLGTVLGSNK